MTEQELSLESLAREVRALRGDVRELVSAWNTARGVVRFVKLIGAMATSVAAIWALWRIGK